MKAMCRYLCRILHGVVLLAGVVALLGAALQFTPWPWRAYRGLGTTANLSARPPTHILVMGGSGIPGESGLMRTFYGALAAAEHPEAELLVAMPRAASESEASQAYLDELARRGVAPHTMRILDRGRNTREQALRLADYLGDSIGDATVLIVSNPEHIRRCAAALRKAGIRHLAVMPAHSLSIEDALPWRAADLEAPITGSAPAAAASTAVAKWVPDVGGSMVLRYNLWAHLGYTLDVAREWTALAYYRLRGWI
ncbi:MAG: YdcF family protein [Kiritimatiellae bacterium]|jgi:uncharacterized SAM-binding protein YcdF (DUF218 family)|nr:YdcF family protein [Kiritimatiellia bacterium]MDD4341517.1 YdcF family protein [Kiritimatiellia bacterium]MDY0149114.1 YdcF family protein [Kiritimatiellia bacterium]